MSSSCEPLMQGGGWRVGVDTGGTFTDVVLVDDAGRIVGTHKGLSTPDDPGRAVLAGIDAVIRAYGGGLTVDAVSVTHGSTVATNALLESEHGEAVFVTTAGFEDTLHLARQNRPELYARVPRRPEPPVPRGRCVGVAERVGHDGRVIAALTDESVGEAVRRVVALRPWAVAISLLHSYANPGHERRLASALRVALPGVHLTVSHELLPEFREYERASVCVINAAVAPRMTRYLRGLAEALGEARFAVMGSHGGTLDLTAVCAEPVRTILSGPAGGVRGAAACSVGVITLDMGGTSTDVALITDAPAMTRQGEAAGLPVRLPMVDIHTVGAGGGSVAWLDPGGALQVGPRSAGADPGPACYGRQRALLERGEQTTWKPTVTDAHVVLGHIAPDQPLGSGLRLDAGAAHAALSWLGDAAGLSREAAAEGVLRIVEVNMARAVHRISLQRGHDPRRYALMPFGGAGGLHACRLAEQLGMSRVIVPPNPGLLSAVGMLTAPPRRIVTRSVHAVWGEDTARLLREAWLPALRDALPGAFRADAAGYRDEADLRYAGQSHELSVEVTGSADEVLGRFHAEHRRLYGYDAADRPVEVVAVRLTADGPARGLHHTAPLSATAGVPSDGRIHRDRLARAQRLVGPVIVMESSATTLVPAGWRLAVRDDGALLLEHA